MKKLIAGNWKMNLTLAESRDLASAIAKSHKDNKDYDLLICPTFLQLPVALEAVKDSAVMVGGQECSEFGNGAYTGEISAEMLKDAGCTHVILGHSERRHLMEEQSRIIADKMAQAHAAGLIVVLCVGETKGERDSGCAQKVIEEQLYECLPLKNTVTGENTIIAYEPVWAIGTGDTATPYDIQDMHDFIRERLHSDSADPEGIRILYGGSVKPDNAAQILGIPNVDGVLVGGASLKASDFLAIAGAVNEL